MGSPKWERLVHQGRAKAHGVPWNDEELHAVYELKIPAEYVRKGILTLEEYELELVNASRETESEKKKSLNQMNKEDLAALADELDIEYDPRTVTRQDLISGIKSLRLEKSKLPENEEVDQEEETGTTPESETLEPDF